MRAPASRLPALAVATAESVLLGGRSVTKPVGQREGEADVGNQDSESWPGARAVAATEAGAGQCLTVGGDQRGKC